MCDVCGGCHIGSGTHTGFIAEQSPLDALHQCNTYATTQCLLPAEGMANDEFDNGRKFSDIDSYNDQCQSNIPNAITGTIMLLTLAMRCTPPKIIMQCGYGNNPSYDGVVETECIVKSAHSCIALYGVEGEAEK